MNEQDFKNIEAPSKSELTLKQKRTRTYIFTAIASLINLVFTIALVFGLIILFTVIVAQMHLEVAQDSKIGSFIMWPAVVIGIFASFKLQNLAIKGAIKLFKLQDKLEPTFVDRYLNGKKAN